ncbi:DUF4230 domain-containing protein [Dysgonomonas sp. Marseille-P4677]|uniref:DUF4230 domain-containing protein n=1 Tax=Dysgonomonas sp. Marseille-P4677 TaxID=2364790 RepID=UPI001913A91D|nr:DUF4230 domain-containing protein [Dysgonomonas sp. Marseille-P4677]MBK5721863.1 DUF4230 domain-containing protein [Dysgonomonas sp. Marseille-P4677]
MVKQRSYINMLAVGILIGGLIMYLFDNNGKDNGKVKVSHNMIVEKIENLGNLEVLQYNIQDLIEYQKMRQWLPNAKTALIVAGEVICCVDLTKVKPEDIYTSGDSIRIKLPAPEICHVKINHSASRIYDMQFGLWESTQIADEAYRHAEKQLKAEAMKLDMESKSRDNTVNLLRPILEAMGFEHVLITFDGGKSYQEKSF